MSGKQHFELHALNLGKLIGNLLMLEMGARMAIAKLEPWTSAQFQTQLPQMSAGDLVEINAFTNGDGLTQTLDKYNKRAPVEFRVDMDSIVKLRDALAHGRTFGYDASKNLRLLKFGTKKEGDKVRVELAEDMTEKWLSENIVMLGDAVRKVAQAFNYEERALS